MILAEADEPTLTQLNNRGVSMNAKNSKPQYEAEEKFWKILRIGVRFQEENTEGVSTNGVPQYPLLSD